MARKLVFAPLAGHHRTEFVNSWHLDALKVLAELDNHTHAHPEAGTETSNPGRFIQKIAITVSPKVFLCEVVYSFTGHAVRWESFSWKVAKAAQSRRPPR